MIAGSNASTHGGKQDTIDLAGVWEISSSVLDAPLPIQIPGDVYSALLAEQILPDPFYADNELQWLPYAQCDWQITRRFGITEHQYQSPRLILDIAVVDTIATLLINDQEVMHSRSMFVPLSADVKRYLHLGENHIAVQLHSAERAAAKEADRLPYPIPCSKFPVQSLHRNLIRKAQCHGGWDWGPALMTAGIYRSIVLTSRPTYSVSAYHCDILEEKSGQWRVMTHIDIDTDCECEIPLSLTIGASETTTETRKISVGQQAISVSLTVRNPQLWWPNGHGAQPHYPLTLRVGELLFEKQIAFRSIVIENKPDQHGKSLRIIVNGRQIMIRGANWIPSDALPARQSDARTRQLLESARAAHMNMLRIWGGGQYESEYVYRYCSEHGILIWQDFMFSCGLYPSSPSFLELVRQEAEAQLKRLKDFPCIALWCGNNENIGALTWYPESIENRDRYLIDYDRLNEGVLGKAVRDIDPQRTFWPSSPCGGPGDYDANWHSDHNGDMHSWSVWHEGKPFEDYYSIIPRFCSEFGFQSFSSIQTTKSFAPPEALNPTHPYLEHHQRHPRGNTIIIETIGRYFRFPNSIEQIIYLSQLQQGLAIKTAVEYWRFHQERCAGMMYWQLNDLWPGASWSSLEYNGGWKLFHYMARRFYCPIHIAAFQDPHSATVRCAIYNDRSESKRVNASLIWYRIADNPETKSEIIHRKEWTGEVAARAITEITLDDLQHSITGRVILSLKLQTDIDGTVGHTVEHTAENLFLYAPPKAYSLPKSTTEISTITLRPDTPPPSYFPHADSSYEIELVATDLALYVSVELQEQFSAVSDNALPILHPGEKRTLFCYVDSSKIPNATALKNQLRIFDLAHSYS